MLSAQCSVQGFSDVPLHALSIVQAAQGDINDGNVPADAQGNGNDAGEDTKGKRARRRFTGERELTEDDYPLLRCLPKLAFGAMPTANDVQQFVNLMAEAPQKASMARLRRGRFKKVLAVS